MSKHPSFRTALGVLAVAGLISVGTVSADILHFDPSHDAVTPPSHSPQHCWQWSAGVMDWNWVCRVGAYRNAYPVNPLQPPAPVRYDYPSYGPGIAGSSLAYVFGQSGQDKERPPAHAD